MSAELQIDFQGVVAFVPNKRFADGPTEIKVVLRNLVEPRIIVDHQGAQRLVGSHHAWLEVAPGDHKANSKEPRGICRVVNSWKKTELDVLLLQKEFAEVRPDSKPLVTAGVQIDASVLAHLATYDGVLKTAYEPDPGGTDEVAIGLVLTGGTLSVIEKTSLEYQVPTHDGKLTSTTVATALRWTIPFQKHVDLRFRERPQKPILRLKPAGSDLLVAFRNREVDELLKPPIPVMGGKDDPEFLVYGDSIVGGSPAVLKSTKGPIPGGHKACGTGGIQPEA
jgi:hypothetical protein